MSEIRSLAPWLKRFLSEHIVTERDLSRNTQASFRDCFKLLLPFVRGKVRKPMDRLTVEDLAVKRILQFLSDLEDNRGCSVQTRNQRLSAIRAFARFIASRDPGHLDWCSQVSAITTKKTTPRAGQRYQRGLGVEQLLDPGAQGGLLLAPQGEVASEIEQGALADPVAAALGADQPVGEVGFAACGDAGSGAPDEHGHRIAAGARAGNPLPKI